MNDYGSVIKEQRKKHQMTQADLAEKLNISAQAVSKWESNLSQPDLDTILKMTQIFGITIEEFTRLAQGEVAATSEERQEPQAAQTENAAPAQPQLIGVCSECGSSIYDEKEIGSRAPKLVCKKCVARKAAAEKAAQEEKIRLERATINAGKAKARRSLRRGLIWPAVGVIAALAIFIVIFVGQEGSGAIIGVGCAIAVLSYLAIPQIVWEYGVLGDIIEWGVTKCFSLPGLIFTLDLDGIIWFITVKLGLMILSILLSIVTTILAWTLCMLIAPFTFCFALGHKIRQVRTGKNLD